MTSPTIAIESRAANQRSALTTPRAMLARNVIARASLLGIGADLLLREGFTGVGFPIWIALLAAATLPLARSRGGDVPAEARMWLGAAILFSSVVAWRDAGELQALNVLATLVAIGMAGAVLAGAPVVSVIGATFTNLAHAALRTAGELAFGAPLLVARDAASGERDATKTRRLYTVLRAIALTVPLVLIFGALLVGADPVFASFIKLPDINFEEAASHVVVAGFFAWVVAGWTRGALLGDRPAAIDLRPPVLGATEVNAALGALTVLFGAFVITQLGWFFGGEALIRERTGLTVAEYARRGFFELMWVAMLILPVLLATRVTVRENDRALAWHTRLSIPLLVLVGAMMVSALGRMQLYVEYYGLTTSRFYATVMMFWLAFVLVWFAATVLRGRARAFTAGVVLSGFAALGLLDASNPDRIVARTNLARARVTPTGQHQVVDLGYLGGLSGDAVNTVLQAVVAPPRAAAGSAERRHEDDARCVAARRLLDQWGPSGRVVTRGTVNRFRGANISEELAIRAVGERAAQLRAIVPDSTACVSSG